VARADAERARFEQSAVLQRCRAAEEEEARLRELLASREHAAAQALAGAHAELDGARGDAAALRARLRELAAKVRGSP